MVTFVSAEGPLVVAIQALVEVLSVGAGAASMVVVLCVLRWSVAYCFSKGVDKGIVDLDSERVGTPLPFMLAWLWPSCGMSGVLELGSALSSIL
jgi:hypothetical protein